MSVATHDGPRVASLLEHDHDERTSPDFLVSRTPAPADGRFEPHLHHADQLAWVREGELELVVAGERWQLRPDHIAWIPATVPHEMTLLRTRELFSVYSMPAVRPAGERWSRPLVLALPELGAAVLGHLGLADPPDSRRRLGIALLYDLLESTPETHDALVVPRDPRARAVAEGILADPADARELQDWAVELGVSTKTLMRAFLADTGGTFGQWRARARMYAAVRLLANGQLVQDVADAVGYTTASGFIHAFRAAFGMTPARYVRHRVALVP